MITKKRRHRDPAWLFAVAKHLWSGRLTFFCYTTSQSNANARLTKASSSPKIEWRETRCLAERGRGRGSLRAGASVPAQRCRETRLFSAVHMISASLAARSFKDRDSANVLGAGKASDTVFGEFRPHVQASSFPRHRGSPSAGPRSAASTAAQGPSPNYCSPYTRVAGLSLQGFILYNACMF